MSLQQLSSTSPFFQFAYRKCPPMSVLGKRGREVGLPSVHSSASVTMGLVSLPALKSSAQSKGLPAAFATCRSSPVTPEMRGDVSSLLIEKDKERNISMVGIDDGRQSKRAKSGLFKKTLRSVKKSASASANTKFDFSMMEGIARGTMASPLGTIRVTASDAAVHAIELLGGTAEGTELEGSCNPPGDVSNLHPLVAQACIELQEYFAGQRKTFSIPMAPLGGTAFQQAVWSSLKDIPFGVTETYGEQARRVGLVVGAARAVGAANGKNPLAIVLPCHRVVGATGALTGYAGGLEKKEFLLKLEQKWASSI
eukprot:TRINITY_DN33638_c0_g1_i1.p1 TRINITY_DN33638_c0_g1~~TRINITY_DN33638_c0_g1_i1.p1  ORF type:complete len:311 (+),score=38.79 TRINITY_DN33638_c0_g1_i1:218-1150(+)